MLLDPARNDHYNIMTALRGPDSEDLDLKFMTTAVVRHFAGVDPNSGAFVYTPEQAKTLWAAMPDEAKARISKSIYFSHFHCHVSTALLSLGTPEAFDYRDWLFAQRILTRWTI